MSNYLGDYFVVDSLVVDPLVVITTVCKGFVYGTCFVMKFAMSFKLSGQPRVTVTSCFVYNINREV